MCQIISVIHLKLNPLLPGSFLKFWGPLPFGGLRQLPNSPKGRAGPDLIHRKSGCFVFRTDNVMNTCFGKYAYLVIHVSDADCGIHLNVF